MAKKIGKYIVTDRESQISAVDGAVITGNLNGITNLTTTGTNTFSGATVTTEPLRFQKKISVLTDKGGAGAIRSALTLADSGTNFLVPELTTGTQTIALPAVTAANVGWWCTFTMIDTAARIFSVETAQTADKIITAEPDGDGTFTIQASANGFDFTATAAKGCSFKITMISATAATAFHISNLNPGLDDNTGEVVAS